MLSAARELVAMALAQGAQFAEGRVVDQRQQVIRSADGKAGISESSTVGFGVRVLVDGHWGFASAGLSERSMAAAIVGQAIALARAMPRRARISRLAAAPVVKAVYETPCAEDPFLMATAEKMELAQAITQAMVDASPLVIRSRATFDFRREVSWLVTSQGTEVEQRLTTTGLTLAVVVEREGQVVERSYPAKNGDYGSGGFEVIRGLRPLEAAKQMVPEAIELLAAPTCEPQVTTVILDSTMMGNLIHETMGHSTELDRALGDESDNFGPSFLQVSMLGSFQYASDIVTIFADATRPGGVATYGYDHEGVPAQKFPLVERGIFKGYAMSRESAEALGLASNGTARASSWNRVPMDRITNLCLAPGTSTKDKLIAETDEGMYIDTVRGSDIDDRRLSFGFVGERGWRIRNGRIVGLVRRPVIYGESATFWRNCTGIAGPEEDRVRGFFGCGKGLPWQFVATGQGGPPARFERVKVGGV